MTQKNEIGFLCAWRTGNEVEIEDIAVEAAFRRNGFGTKMLLQLIQENRDCTFFLEVRQSNFPARRLYEKLGFQAYRVRADYYSNPTENAICMKLEAK